jgi:hypothetical protein
MYSEHMRVPSLKRALMRSATPRSTSSPTKTQLLGVLELTKGLGVVKAGFHTLRLRTVAVLANCRIGVQDTRHKRTKLAGYMAKLIRKVLTLHGVVRP